ncbi:MAG: AI-2E family transporter [Clostridia bacterium]|nr:AI-2E family transporter [Clostridia bacterium]
MNNKGLKKEYLIKGITAFLVIAACVLFAFLVFKIRIIWSFITKIISVLSPVIIGLVIAYLVNPMVRFFDKGILKIIGKKAKKPEKAARVADVISVLLAILVFAIVIVGLFWLVIPQLIDSVSDFVKSLPNNMEKVSDWGKNVLKENKRFQTVFASAIDYGEKWLKTDLAKFASNAAANLASGVLSVMNFLKNFGLGLIFAIYLLFNKDRMVNQSKKMLFALLSEKTVSKILSWLSTSHKVFSGFINGKLLDSLIMGVLCFIGTTILGIPYALLVSVIVGVTNLIPVFGPYIGGVPSALLVLIANPMKGLYFIILVIFLQLLDGNFIGPKILGDKTGLSNFWVMFAIVVGGGLFGVIGMLVGVPAFAVIYYAFVVFVNYKLKKKNKSTSSDDYSSEALEKAALTETGEE